MYRKEVNAQSPLRILERSIHGGLGAGNMGVVMARAGVGKTAFLVQIALDDLMRERDVLHIALGKTVDHVQQWYDALFEDLARDNNLEDKEQVKVLINRHRVIQAYQEHTISAEKLEKVVSLYSQHVKLKPAAILLDGYDWEAGKPAERAAELAAVKALAKRLGAELWVSAQTHRSTTPPHPTQVPPPCDCCLELIDVAVYLEPHGHLVSVRLLKDHDNASVSETHLELEPDTLQLITDAQAIGRANLPTHAYTLLSGGCNGAEAEFGAMAEKWGMHETNYSFEGRSAARTRGLVELSEIELKQGEVSTAYVEKQLHRQFPQTPTFRRMLQTIWHQVATSGQIFVIGLIQEDNTVRGGTGWAAELAKHFNKPVHVYDQERRGWFTWSEGAWVAEERPKINRTRFTGTGTRFLSDEGQAAIRQLFEDSFGQLWPQHQPKIVAALVGSLTLGLAPFTPHPHIYKQLVNLAQGQLTEPMDIFDLLMHGAPWLLLFYFLGRFIWAARKV